MEKSRKKFIKVPTLGGGRELLRKIMKENMIYPREALEKNIEGDVIVEYRVNNLGHVSEARVIHGIGHGCDEEALRLVKLLKYQEVKNRGLKVSTNNKMKIPFRIKKKPKQPLGIKMTYVAAQSTAKQAAQPHPTNKKTYTYAIPLGGKNQ